MTALADLGATVTFADFGHLFGGTGNDGEWEQLLVQWCGRPVSIPELDGRLDALAGPQLALLPLLPGVEELLRAARAAGWGVAPRVRRLDGAFNLAGGALCCYGG